jgi:MFS family permease
MDFKKTKYACYYTYLAMSSVFSLPPILFVTFRNMYGISYTLLGTLVLINFCTQLSIDLIFSFFSRHFNIQKTVRVMPLLTSLGLLIYALVPLLFPDLAYAGLVFGTVVFSAAAGLCEVLLSPLVAALPSDNHERDMSTLHSLYAYGVLFVILLSTVFLNLFGTSRWMYLTIFWAMLPVASFVLFCIVPLPKISISSGNTGTAGKSKSLWLALFACCIFLGSAAENAMTNWISGYAENALHISKALGDILGMAVFALLLGMGRTLYARFGKRILPVLLLGMAGSAVCYLIAGLSANAVLCLAACAFTGFCVSMLWPGTLILMEQVLPNAGIAAYALMAAGGDFGGSVAPQLLGIVVDQVSANPLAAELGRTFSLNAEQIGLKAGMLASAVFPVIGTVVILVIRHLLRKQSDHPSCTQPANP